MDLELIEKESKVGGYSADILAREADTDLLDKKYRPAKKNNMKNIWRACIIA